LKFTFHNYPSFSKFDETMILLFHINYSSQKRYEHIPSPLTLKIVIIAKEKKIHNTN